MARTPWHQLRVEEVAQVLRTDLANGLSFGEVESRAKGRARARNLITDGLPALALAMEKPEADVMSRRPRPPKEPFFTRRRGSQILIHGFVMATVNIGGFAYAYTREGSSYAQATAFYITTFAQLFFSFACRSQRYTLPQLGALTNPYLLAAIAISGILQMSVLWFPLTREVFFKATPQFGSDWLVVFLLALAPVSLVEITKLVRSRHRRRDPLIAEPS